VNSRFSRCRLSGEPHRAPCSGRSPLTLCLLLGDGRGTMAPGRAQVICQGGDLLIVELLRVARHVFPLAEAHFRWLHGTVDDHVQQGGGITSLDDRAACQWWCTEDIPATLVAMALAAVFLIHPFALAGVRVGCAARLADYVRVVL